MSEVMERFLRYVSYDTQSEDDAEEMPSTKKQLVLGKLLRDELKQMGAENVRMDEHGYVYAAIPGNAQKPVPALGFIAHMDTAPAFSGTGVKLSLIHI